MSTDTMLMENILRAANLSDAEIAARVADIGPDVVAQAMLAEVACRASLLAGPANNMVIQCDLGFDGGRLGYLLVLGTGGPSVEQGWNDASAAVLRQDLVDLLRELWGPPGPCGATRELFSHQYFEPASVAGMRQLVAAISQHPKNLSDLAVQFGSDKWGGHWYTPHYQKYFEPYRELAVKVLEIGVGGYRAPGAGGESLRMWKHYFRRGLIYGLDIFDKTDLSESRLRVLQGDQGDAGFLDSLARQYGPFDIVIDDGSHISNHILTSFRALFPHVRPGGIYVIEDLLTAYWPSWGGDPDPSAQYQTMVMVKDLLDGLHHQEQIRASDQGPSVTELAVTGVHVHHNMALIEKGINTEQGGPAWLRATDHSRMYCG